RAQGLRRLPVGADHGVPRALQPDGYEMKRPPISLPTVPRDLVALESDDGELAVLSFTLPGDNATNLSRAESDVARLILAGRTNAEIAAIRRCSTRTVANQVAS